MNQTQREGPSRGSLARRSPLLAMIVAAAALIPASPAGCDATDGAPAAFADSLIRGLQRDTLRAMRKDRIRGLAVAVADAERSWTAGFGSAGAERPVTARTPMLLASLTKLFTGLAVMKLVEEGRVGLDAAIGTYVPAMAGVRFEGAPEPTVRDLLTHHGGLVSDLLAGTLYGGPSAGHREAFMALIPLIAAESPTEPPKRLAHYSNTGYELLGALVANVSGRPYVDYVQEEILGPLAMSDSGFLDPWTDQRLSRGFTAGREVSAPRMAGLPEGGLCASADDLGRFLQMLLREGRLPADGRVVRAPTLRAMMSRQNAAVDLDLDFEMGLAFHIMALPGYPGVRVAWHDGGTAPFASTLLVAADYGVGVALVSNTDEKVPAELAYEMLAKVIEAKTGGRLERSRGYRFGPMGGRPLEPDELPGVYASELGAIRVAGRPGKATLTMNGNTLYLVPREQQSYGVQARLFGVLPLPIADLARLRVAFREVGGGRVAGIYQSGKFRSVALAVEPADVPAAWEARFGGWSVVNPDPEPFVTGVRLGFDKGLGLMTLSVKVATIAGPLVFPVVARGDNALVTAGLGRHMGETLRVSRDQGGERMSWAGLVLAPENHKLEESR
jgi:CubicO group peptidase (beta-lactamase class C family)